MNAQDAIFNVIDTETTGFDSEKDALVEIAAVAVSPKYGVLGMWATLIDPGIPIPPEVSAVHYLTDVDVAGKMPKAAALSGLKRFHDAMGASAAVAHNAAFDSAFLNGDDMLGYIAPSDWICTRRLAAHVWPEAPTHKNQGLRFWRGLEVDTFGILPHRALGDALVTAALLLDILECASDRLRTVDEVRLLSQAPIRVTKWPLGKYRGQPLDVDRSYVQWALGPRGMSDMDPDLRWSLNQVLSGAG